MADASCGAAVTACVFCAVSAVSAVAPWTPACAKALRSAWTPAPPPESDVAIVNARGTMTPFAGTNRIRFDGSDLSRLRAAPRYRQASNAPLDGVRLLSLVGVVGLWQAAASLGAPLLVTALLTAGAAALGVWALAVLRDG